MVAWYWIPISLVALVIANRIWQWFVIGALINKNGHVKAATLKTLAPGVDSVNAEIPFGSTGYSPGGVSYAVTPLRGGALIDKGRNKFRRKR